MKNLEILLNTNPENYNEFISQLTLNELNEIFNIILKNNLQNNINEQLLANLSKHYDQLTK